MLAYKCKHSLRSAANVVLLDFHTTCGAFDADLLSYFSLLMPACAQP